MPVQATILQPVKTTIENIAPYGFKWIPGYEGQANGMGGIVRNQFGEVFTFTSRHPQGYRQSYKGHIVQYTTTRWVTLRTPFGKRGLVDIGISSFYYIDYDQEKLHRLTGPTSIPAQDSKGAIKFKPFGRPIGFPSELSAKHRQTAVIPEGYQPVPNYLGEDLLTYREIASSVNRGGFVYCFTQKHPTGVLQRFQNFPILFAPDSIIKVCRHELNLGKPTLYYYDATRNLVQRLSIPNGSSRANPLGQISFVRRDRPIPLGS